MKKNTKILVTGGAGYIGSHCMLKLIDLGYHNLISIDNFSNSSDLSFRKIEEYTGQKIQNENIDLKDGIAVKRFFERHSNIKTIIHLAALKDPFESIIRAQDYYENNVGGIVNLLKYSVSTNLSKFILSSTCAIYGEPITIPVKESHPINPQNPYASSKWMCENILRDIAKNRDFKVVSLRYFNPVGSNAVAGLKEHYTNRSKNIIPQILRVLKGEQEVLNVYGNELPTKDGSGIRDYIHVEDLAEAHITAMEFLDYKSSSYDYNVFNLGTGKGISVFELLNEFEKEIGKKIPISISSKRQNEVVEIYADTSRINKQMDWEAKKSLNQMVIDILKTSEIIIK